MDRFNLRHHLLASVVSVLMSPPDAELPISDTPERRGKCPSLICASVLKHHTFHSSLSSDELELLRSPDYLPGEDNVQRLPSIV